MAARTGTCSPRTSTFRTLFDDIGEEDPIHLFSNVTFGGEVLFGMGDWLEAGVGISYFESKERFSFYTDFTDLDGTDIEQTTQFRIVPLALTVRAFPIGRTTPVQPYVGGGINFYRWKVPRSRASSSTSATTPCRSSRTRSPMTAARSAPCSSAACASQ